MNMSKLSSKIIKVSALWQFTIIQWIHLDIII